MDKALKILEEITSHGYKAYFVGGYVRNHLLGLPSNDIDITTNATPKELMDIFEESIPTEDYGSVTINKKAGKYEITTFRKEYDYVDHRRPKEIKYIDDLYEDLLRRDFTINTICMDKDQNIIDLLNGREDLEKRVIKSVGDPKTKFNDDALRMLRAVRFATILDFRLDNEVVEAIKLNKEYIRELSYTRKKEELDKIFSSNNSYKGIKLLLELGLDEVLELNRLKDINPNNSSIGIWSVLNVVDKYPFTNNEKEQMSLINRALERNNLDPMSLYKYGLYANSVAASIKNIDIKDVTESYNNLVIHARKELAITSNEIIALLNRFPGELMSDIYEDVEHEVLYKNLPNDKESITTYILNNYKD